MREVAQELVVLRLGWLWVLRSLALLREFSNETHIHDELLFQYFPRCLATLMVRSGQS